MSGRQRRGLSLTEVVIAIFLLAFVALSVVAIAQTGFVAQRRTQHLAKATLVAQATLAEIRVWATNYSNFRSGWSNYNRTFISPDHPEYTITIRSQASGRPIETPCSEMESQWAAPLTQRGTKIMPTAIVPVEITVSWSPDPSDSFQLLSYVGEPKRPITDPATDITLQYSGPSPTTLAVGDVATYSIIARDASGQPFDNLIYSWIVDRRFVVPAPDSPRDGRSFKALRLPNPAPPAAQPPIPPALSLVECRAQYAGLDLSILPRGLELSP